MRSSLSKKGNESLELGPEASQNNSTLMRDSEVCPDSTLIILVVARHVIVIAILTALDLSDSVCISYQPNLLHQLSKASSS